MRGFAGKEEALSRPSTKSNRTVLDSVPFAKISLNFQYDIPMGRIDRQSSARLRSVILTIDLQWADSP